MELTLPQLGGLGDLGYGLSIGANFDFSDSKYVIQNWDNLTTSQRSEAVRQAAWDFMEDYSISRGIPYSTSAGELPLDTKGFFKSVYFESNIKQVFSNYLTAEDAGLNSDATLRMPISRQAVTDWTLYRENAWKRYKDSFSSISVSEDPELPAEYSWFETVNSLFLGTTNIIDYDKLIIKDGYGDINLFDYLNKYTIIGANFTNNNNHSTGGLGGGLGLRLYCIPSIISINLTTNQDNSVVATYSDYTAGSFGYFNDMGNRINIYQLVIQGVNNAGYLNNYWSYSDQYWTNIYAQTNFSDLDSAINYIFNHYSNINLYVDDILWVTSEAIDDAPADVIIPDFPDVIDPDGELPVDLVDLPNTTNYEGTFDITSLFDALQEAIAGASDSDDTTSGTLTGEAVTDTYRDTTGELVADATLPLADILDDSFPIQDTKNYPNLPMYDEPIHNAFQGTTILSELIDATQKSLPEELVAALWGIIFILFIIGLIKVLHK